MVQINFDQRGKLPPVQAPVTFQSKDGCLKGWAATLPGGHLLATPAVLDGRVFLGGGFGSYEFYALDAATGKLVWQYQTTDDGPTAAVAWVNFVVFSTESCELEVVTVKGQPVWKQWLGDPLMSMPAVADGFVYTAFPDGRGDHRHYLAAFEIQSGRQAWRSPIDAEVITAPVVTDGHVYLTNLAGTLFCFQQTDGVRAWQSAKNATSSPMVWKGECYFSQREVRTGQTAGKPETYQTEQLAVQGAYPDAPMHAYLKTARRADYLDHAKRLRGSPRHAASADCDAQVGFAGHKGDARMYLAMQHLGRGNVHEVWSYQGSKPFIHRGRLYSALGDTVQCLDPATREVIWKKHLGPDKPAAEMLDSLLTPPTTVNGKVFLGSLLGDVFCLSAVAGDEIWRFRIGEPIVFPPAVAKGRAYVPTDKGVLYCLETGDEQDDGWNMWGATAAHNGLAD